MTDFLPDQRQAGGDRVLLVHPRLPAGNSPEDEAEFQELATSAGLTVAGSVAAPRGRPDPATYVGSGKAEEIARAVAEYDVETVLFNATLSPIQERNLERKVCCRVHDRNTLILDIFAQRARSHEGKLQVELAQLRHLSTRLVRGWTHLERQKGGIGLRGPGETQLETDRRLLGLRVRTLTRRLEKLSRQRRQGRRARDRGEVPLVSLVGYTNAGKSTLFNRLTEGEVYAADQLFATLDPTLRRLKGSDGADVILADTVGFIRHLPHELVAAFKSTLEETREADLLLHVVDAADPAGPERVDAVCSVLKEIGAENVPQILVNNKIDRLGQPPGRVRRKDAESVFVSALTGEGLGDLLEAVSEQLSGIRQAMVLQLGPADGRLRARLHELGLVIAEEHRDDGGCAVDIELAPRERQLLAREWPDHFPPYDEETQQPLVAAAEGM